MNDQGYIRARCPLCGGVNRVLVTFPAFNKPFNPTIHTCRCGAEFIVYDPHKYRADGKIIN